MSQFDFVMDLIVLMKLSKCKEESSTLQIVICIQYFIRLVYTNLRCVSEAKVYVLLRVVVNFDIYNQVMPNLSIIMMDFLLLKKKKNTRVQSAKIVSKWTFVYTDTFLIAGIIYTHLFCCMYHFVCIPLHISTQTQVLPRS